MTTPVPMRFPDTRLLWTVDAVYSVDECEHIIAQIERDAPTLATNNPLYRNQDRVIRDDPAFADDLARRLRPSLPDRIGDLEYAGLNPRLRYYRYGQGQQFKPHMDHWYEADAQTLTLLTVLVYFNAVPQGGQTRFMEQLEAVVDPAPGRVAIFQHKVRHEGCEVLRGKKYAMRSDVFYRAPSPVELTFDTPR